MADLNFKAQIELIDKMTAPMRSLSSQAGRLGRQFGETAKQAKQLQSQQRLIDKFRKQSEQIKQTTDRYKAAEERLAMLSSKMNSTTTPTRTLTKQFEAAGRSFARVENKLKSQKLALSQTDNKLKEAGFSTSKLSDHERKLAQQIEATNQKLGERRQRLDKVNQIQKQSQQMGEMRNKAAALSAGGMAATYAGARFVQPGVDLETSMSKVQALTRLDKNSEQYKALEAQAKQLGATTQFTSADAARGQAFLAMAGFTPQSIQAAMPGMLDLALAGDMDLDRTADIASNILTGMKLDPTKMTDVADVLSAAFTRANVDIGMLGETMKYAAPGASGLGVSLQEVAAMAGKLGDAGIQGSMGGTALRTIMSRLAAPPKAAAGAMHALGLKVTDANGNLRKMPDILQELHEKTKDMGNTERLKYLKDIAGEEAGSAMQVLVDKAGTGELQELVATLEGANGEASKLSKTMADNTDGDWKALTSGLDAFRTSVFGANKDTIRGFMQNITALSQRMTAFANAHPELIAFLGKVFGILAVGAVVFGTVGAALLTVLGPMAMLRASLVTLGLPTTLTPLSMLSKAFGLVGGALKSLGAAAVAHPLLAFAAAIAIAAIYIWRNWDTLGPKFNLLWALIKLKFAEFKLWMILKWDELKQNVINYANQLWSGLGIKFNSGIGALIGIILAFSPVGLFIRVFAAVWNYFSGLYAKFKQYGSNILQGLKDGIMSKANAVIKSITGIAGRIKNAFTGARAMDIHSPSRVFDKYGVNIMQGLGGGIMRWGKWPVRKLQDVANNMRGQSFAIRPSFMPEVPTQQSKLGALWNLAKRVPAVSKAQRLLANYSPINLDTIMGTGRYIKGQAAISSLPPINLDTRKSILPGVGASHSYRNSTSNMSMGGITININGAMDPMSVAQQVRREIEQVERERASRRRSRLSDID